MRKVTGTDCKYRVYYRDVTETVKKDVSKCTEMTKKSKAVQTAQEEKIKIKVEDLTSGIFKIYIFFCFPHLHVYF